MGNQREKLFLIDQEKKKASLQKASYHSSLPYQNIHRIFFFIHYIIPIKEVSDAILKTELELLPFHFWNSSCNKNGQLHFQFIKDMESHIATS